jgi:single-strand DNA-binding protein
MANLNRVLLIGNLTRDPELRVTPKGTAICQFGLAVNRSFKDAAGQTRDETTFIDVEAWGRQGEVISKYCTKGRALFVEGRLRYDQWEDKTSGQKRSRLSVVLENFQFIGAGRGDGPGAGGADESDPGHSPAPERHSPPPRAARPAPVQEDNLDEDVPF